MSDRYARLRYIAGIGVPKFAARTAEVRALLDERDELLENLRRAEKAMACVAAWIDGEFCDTDFDRSQALADAAAENHVTLYDIRKVIARAEGGEKETDHD